jgi:formate/nitrite transporter
MRIDQSRPARHQALDFGTSEKPIRGINDLGIAASSQLIAPSDLVPSQTAERLVGWSTAKSTLSADRLIVLGLLAGLFIAIGGAFFTGVMAVSSLGHGPSRLLGGIVFSSGLLLVCVSGAELSTGNCMLFTAWAARRITLTDVGRNLLISYGANAAGALAFAILISKTGLLQSEHGHTAAAIAEAKMTLSFGQAFVRGIMCNALVCIAVWMIMSARTIPSKFAGLVFPISAFITLGFEHSIANFYLLPAGLLAGAAGSLGSVVTNLVAVTLGNLVGGLIVALAFWAAYLRSAASQSLDVHHPTCEEALTKPVPLPAQPWSWPPLGQWKQPTAPFQRSKPWGVERGTVICRLSHCPTP